MPELPEVETVRRGLEKPLTGARIKSVQLGRKGLRFPFPRGLKARLQDRRISSLHRRAKYLLVNLDGGDTLIIHLGMSGRLTLSHQSDNAENRRRAPAKEPALPAFAPGDPKHDHVKLCFDTGGVLTYNDPRRFGFIDITRSSTIETHRLFAKLGPEPLGNGFSSLHLAQKALGRKTDLKAFLLDQRTVAGLGNIYVCEALFRARLSPRRHAGVLATKTGRPTARAERLAPAMRAVLTDAIHAGGSSLKDYRQPDGAMGYFQHAFDVYGRDGQACRREKCAGKIKRITQAGRSTFYCSKCQN